MDRIKAKIEEILKGLDDLDAILEKSGLEKGRHAERIIKVFRRMMSATIKSIDSLNEESK